MKKVFISQPMRNKTNEEIIAEREKAIAVLKEKYGEDIEVLDTFFKDTPHDGSKGLWYLGESLKFMSQADIVYFCKDWDKYRGCKIEKLCAVEYDIENINFDEI